MAYKDRFNNKHHQNNNEEIETIVETTTNATDETLVIEAENNTEEVIEDYTILAVEPIKEEEVKMEEVVNNTIPAEENKVDDKQKEIEELNNNIKAWEAQLIKSRNNILNATLHDKLMTAKLRIRDIKSALPKGKIETVSGHTIADRGKKDKRLESIEDHIIRIF